MYFSKKCVVVCKLCTARLPNYYIQSHPQSLSEVYISSNKLHSKKSHVAKFMTSSIDPFIKGYPQCKFTTDTMSGNL